MVERENMSANTMTRSYHDENASVTLAEVSVGRLYFQTTASAKRHPVDQPDPTVGELLSTGRALVKLGKQLIQQAWYIINERNGR